MRRDFIALVGGAAVLWSQAASAQNPGAVRPIGVLLSLEPAIALVIGLLVLRQVPGPGPVIGVAFVVAAGIGAERTGARAVRDPAVPAGSTAVGTAGPR